jgi:uncharacterized membrane protein (UPF0127 family)
MLRGFLTGLGVVGVCAFLSTTFYVVYMRSEMAVALTTPLSDFPHYQSARLEIDGRSIRVAIADTPALQSLGLGNRSGLGADEGMLFVFPVDRPYAFWMKDMHFSIDMLWLSAQGVIVYMAQNVSPETYPKDFVPTAPARFVLELPAGYAQAHSFIVGDRVVISNLTK